MHLLLDQRKAIRQALELLEKFTGKRPKGWLGPGLTETWDTPDILAEEGYEYVCDWVLDDQPVVLKTRGGSIVSVPYTQECNDVAMMLIQHHAAAEYRNRAIDQFDQLYADAAAEPRVMALVVHPYIMGVPHRVRYFREALAHIRSHPGVVFTTGSEICDAFLACAPAKA
jgi:peptidoglycan/xylan/chitin deacetylase (PgdA/CDA1 family)